MVKYDLTTNCFFYKMRLFKTTTIFYISLIYYIILYMEEAILRMLDGKTSKRSVVDQLYKRPKRDENGDNPTMPRMAPNYCHYIDLLYLPNDNGMKYCLTVVDQGSRYVGATALEDRTVDDIVKALKLVYRQSKVLKIPTVIVSDNGSEFLGNFNYEIYKIGVKEHKCVKAGRHRSVALAERKNQTIGKIIHKILSQVQLTSGNPSSKWVSHLPLIIKLINGKVQEANDKMIPEKIEDLKPITFNPDHDIDLLNEGDRVRVALDEPIDVDENKLKGTFRSSDIRWNPTIRTVRYMYMKPNQPIMYFLDGEHGNLKIETVGYTRNQLLKVSKQEKSVKTVTPLFENEKDRYEIDTIKDRAINEDKQTMYLVKFKKIRKAVWIERSELMKDIGKSSIKTYDTKFDKIQNK